jgi:signal transduction histidine kinase
LAAERIDAAHPDEHLPLPQAHDEIFRLTQVLNGSFDRLRRAYEAAARFSADASHQLITPLTVLRAGLEECRATGGLSSEPREIAESLLRKTRRLASLVEDLMLLAQADAGRLHLETGPVPLAATLAPLLDDLDAACTSQGLTLSVTMPDDLLVIGDARRIGVIFQNLAENSVKYCAPQGRVTVRAWREDTGICVSVENTGTPISGERRALIFERFNRAGRGEDIQGHGLGLNIARELARAQGGDVMLERSDDSGTCFSFCLRAA